MVGGFSDDCWKNKRLDQAPRRGYDFWLDGMGEGIGVEGLCQFRCI